MPREAPATVVPTAVAQSAAAVVVIILVPLSPPLSQHSGLLLWSPPPSPPPPGYFNANYLLVSLMAAQINRLSSTPLLPPLITSAFSSGSFFLLMDLKQMSLGIQWKKSRAQSVSQLPMQWPPSEWLQQSINNIVNREKKRNDLTFLPQGTSTKTDSDQCSSKWSVAWGPSGQCVTKRGAFEILILKCSAGVWAAFVTNSIYSSWHMEVQILWRLHVLFASCPLKQPQYRRILLPPPPQLALK